jgi:hypothetical protein
VIVEEEEEEGITALEKTLKGNNKFHCLLHDIQDCDDHADMHADTDYYLLEYDAKRREGDEELSFILSSFRDVDQ